MHFWAHLCILHSGLIGVAFCLSVCLSVVCLDFTKDWTRIHISESIIGRCLKLYHNDWLHSQKKIMSASGYGIIALTGRAHCQRQVAFFFIPSALKWAHPSLRHPWNQLSMAQGKSLQFCILVQTKNLAAICLPKNLNCQYQNVAHQLSSNPKIQSLHRYVTSWAKMITSFDSCGHVKSMKKDKWGDVIKCCTHHHAHAACMRSCTGLCECWACPCTALYAGLVR